VTASVRVPEHLSRECLAPLGDYLVATFDHRLLNEQVSFHPTSELLAAHLAQWCRDHLQPAGVRLVAVEVSETPSTSARCDGVTGEVTIAKTYRVGAGAVTVTLGADGLDEVGFIIDFGALEPFAAHLHDVCDASGQVFSPVAVGSLAMWFVHEFEPSIRARLLSVRCENPTVSALWERSGHR
jgi:6-pyruvoyl-tetrahydropterin synthase